MDKNPELAVEDWTLEFLCKRNGSLLQEEHYFAGFQLVKNGCFASLVPNFCSLVNPMDADQIQRTERVVW